MMLITKELAEAVVKSHVDSYPDADYCAHCHTNRLNEIINAEKEAAKERQRQFKRVLKECLK